MFQLDEKNGIRNAAILWLIFFAIFYCIFSCAAGDVKPEASCPATQVNAPDPLDPEVQEHLGYAGAGCIRQYGEGACLIRLTRLGYRDYHATCRRREKPNAYVGR